MNVTFASVPHLNVAELLVSLMGIDRQNVFVLRKCYYFIFPGKKKLNKNYLCDPCCS